MAPPIVQFVDSISASAAIRLNLMNLAGLVVGPDGIDLSPPRMRYTMSDSMLTDGSRAGAAVYENRVLRIPLRYTGTPDPDVAAAAIGLLGRELDRPTNIMKLQLGSTPVWFRTIRNSYTLEMLRLAFGQRKQTKTMLEIPAEPFGIGARVDLGPYTINNDPAHATNPQKIILPSITGDVETPAFIYTQEVLYPTTETVAPMIAVSRGPSAVAPLAWGVHQPSSGGSFGADSSIVADAAASTGEVLRITFATNQAMVGRYFNVLAANLAPGRYTVLARVKRSVSGDVVKLRYVQLNADAVSVAYQSTVTCPTGTGGAIIRLGTIQTPLGSSLRESGYSGITYPGEERFLIEAQRVSGSGNLDIDYLLYVPADYATMAAKFPTGTAPAYTVWDGISEVARWLDGAPFNTATKEIQAIVQAEGGFPTLRPGGENVLHFLRNIDRGAGTLADLITYTTAINLAYWPRYLVTP